MAPLRTRRKRRTKAHFKQIPEPFTDVDEDEIVLLKCEAESPTQTHFLWSKDMSPIFVNKTKVLDDPDEANRFELIGDISKGEYNLQIKKVTLRDQGNYQCQATPAVIPIDENKEAYFVLHKLKVVPKVTTAAAQKQQQQHFHSDTGSNVKQTTFDSDEQLPGGNNQIPQYVTVQSNYGLGFGSTNSKQAQNANPNHLHHNAGGQSLLQARDIASSAPTRWLKVPNQSGYNNNNFNVNNNGIHPSQLSPSSILTSSHPIQPLSSNIRSSSGGHSNVLASTSGASPTSGQSIALLLSSWPCILLLIAAILMAINVYLICSIIKRRLNCSASVGSSNSSTNDTDETNFESEQNNSQQKIYRSKGHR